MWAARQGEQVAPRSRNPRCRGQPRPGLSKLCRGRRGITCGSAACCVERLRLSVAGAHSLTSSAPAEGMSLLAAHKGNNLAISPGNPEAFRGAGGGAVPRFPPIPQFGQARDHPAIFGQRCAELSVSRRIILRLFILVVFEVAEWCRMGTTPPYQRVEDPAWGEDFAGLARACWDGIRPLAKSTLGRLARCEAQV